MGILAPLFLAGLAGLALPLIFHLVRRTPRGKQAFSSLMFLAPTPPRLTRRSRLDQVVLLLLRLAALTLIAFAFTRPFVREAELLSWEALPQRRVALLLDTSASLRRGDLWQQALERVTRELDQLAPHDEVALYTFSDRLITEVSFLQDKTVSATSQRDVIKTRLRALQPTWNTTDLGVALATLAAELDASHDAQQSSSTPQIVLISDVQHGARLEALQGLVWPEQVRVIPQFVTVKPTTNATVQLLAVSDEDPEGEPRVRVTNSPDATEDQFHVRWFDARQPKSMTGEVAVYVPPGQSRVVQLPRPESLLHSDRIVLRGDAHDFDNTWYVVPPRPQEMTVQYLGEDAADDPQGLQYYLRLAWASDALRSVTFTDGKASATMPRLIVVTRTLSEAEQQQLTAAVEQGATLIVVPQDRAAAATLLNWLPEWELGPEPLPTGKEDFQLLGEIDFTHPLFAPFANPRYNDFTRIHFWRSLPLQLRASVPATTRMMARFDNGTPWLLERAIGQGQVYLMTSGWRPDDSQLAVSSKFVPLFGHLLDQASGLRGDLSSTLVQAPVPLLSQRTRALTLSTPSGKSHSIPVTATEFRETIEPGIYQAGSGSDEFRFAVNLAPSESQTAPMPLEMLEQLGVRFATEVTAAVRLDQARQARDTELESQQQVWRWLLVGGLLVLLGETWWSGRAARRGARESRPVTVSSSPGLAGGGEA